MKTNSNSGGCAFNFESSGYSSNQSDPMKSINVSVSDTPHLQSRKVKRTRDGILPPVGLRFFIIILLVLGIFFRFVNLERKVFWLDEIATTSNISGFTDYQGTLKGQISTVSDLRKHQHPEPEINIIDTVQNVAKLDPHISILYYAIARFWAEWFGSSVAVMRSLSAFISLLVFPCLYWLCLELFQTSLVGWIAVALIAVSPFHVLYAQEARMYSLQTVMILLSSAALLRAIRVNTALCWGFYAVSLSLSIYTHMLSLFVAIAHGIYVVAIEGVRRSKVLSAYLITTLVGLLTFLPWFFVVLTNYDRVSNSTKWQNQMMPVSSLMTYWGINLSRIFLDLIPTYQTDTDFSAFKNPWSISLITILLIMVGYSIYFLYHHSSRRSILFIFTLMVVSVLPLVLQDLIFGGIRSYVNRYLIAFYLGIHLAVAYLIATKITSASAKLWQQKLWQIALITLISCGVLSCAIISPAETWWNKYFGAENIQIARIVNQSKSPLLLLDKNWQSKTIWSMNDFLQPKVRFQFLAEKNISGIPDGFSDIFLFTPSKDLQDGLEKEQKVKIKPVFDGTLSLWKLEKF